MTDKQRLHEFRRYLKLLKPISNLMPAAASSATATRLHQAPAMKYSARIS